MKVYIPQIKYRSNNISYNTEEIKKAINKAKKEKADLIVFPELAISGGLPSDLFEKRGFVDECRMAVEKIAQICNNIAAIIGCPLFDEENNILFNSAFFLKNGEVAGGCHKTILKDYDVYNESRYFIEGDEADAIKYMGENIRIIFDEYERESIKKDDTIVVYISATPFSSENVEYREKALSYISKECSKHVIYSGLLASNTDLIFEGGICVFNKNGVKVCDADIFEEGFICVDTKNIKNLNLPKKQQLSDITLKHKAIIFGIREYFSSNNFKSAVIGLSGGIDSAIIAALISEAIGAERLKAVLMPSKYSSESSITDSVELAKRLNIDYSIVPISNIFASMNRELQEDFKGQKEDITEENIQARIRAVIVMAFSNKFKHILVNTSNKSEIAVGYGTLYGDMCGSISPIGDLYKTEVYKLAMEINKEKEIIPKNIITKAPSAELRPNQKDQDSLPDYEILDKILKLYLEENIEADEIIKQGIDKSTVEKTIELVKRNEFKRAQAAPVIRLSDKSFGRGRRMPL